MSFANLQQVEMRQGPVQRFLGLGDVHVQSAGGGGEHEGKESGDSLHTGTFHCVDNATEIRDLILRRLRKFRQAGLGDPDDSNHATPETHAPESAVATANTVAADDAVTAARELLAEVRALRSSVG